MGDVRAHLKFYMALFSKNIYYIDIRLGKMRMIKGTGTTK